MKKSASASMLRTTGLQAVAAWLLLGTLAALSGSAVAARTWAGRHAASASLLHGAARRHLLGVTGQVQQQPLQGQETKCWWWSQQPDKASCGLNPYYVASDQMPEPSNNIEKVIAEAMLRDATCKRIQAQKKCEQVGGCAWDTDPDVNGCMTDPFYDFVAMQRGRVFCPGSLMDDIKTCAATPRSRCKKDTRCVLADPEDAINVPDDISPALESFLGFVTDVVFMIEQAFDDSGYESDPRRCLAAWLTDEEKLQEASTGIDAEYAKYGSNNDFTTIFADAVLGDCKEVASFRNSKADCFARTEHAACQQSQACMWTTDVLPDEMDFEACTPTMDVLDYFSAWQHDAYAKQLIYAIFACQMQKDENSCAAMGNIEVSTAKVLEYSHFFFQGSKDPSVSVDGTLTKAASDSIVDRAAHAAGTANGLGNGGKKGAQEVV